MKHLVLAALAASLAASVAPAFAKTGLTLAETPAIRTQQDIERRSGRCPGGEMRFFVPGCGGV